MDAHPLLALLDPATTLIAGGWCRDRLYHSERVHDFDLLVYRGTLDEALEAILAKYTSRFPNARKVAVTTLNQDRMKSRRQRVLKLEFKHFDCQVDLTELAQANPSDRAALLAALKVDAELRDFTINALYYDIAADEILDPLGCGLADAEAGAIRPISDSALAEDSVRVLRAARFLCMYPHLQISGEAMKLFNDKEVVRLLCEECAEDRVRSEFCRLLKYDTDRGLHFLHRIDPLILKRGLSLLTATNARDWTRRARIELFLSEHTLMAEDSTDGSGIGCSDQLQ